MTAQESSPTWRTSTTFLEWNLPPDEYDRRVRQALWNILWERAETLLENWEERMVSSPELSESERAKALEQRAELQAMVDHKRTVEGLGSADR